MRWIERWMTVHAVVLLTSLVVLLIFKNISFLAISAAISFVALFVFNGKRLGGFSFLFESANLVTSLRLCTLLGTVFCFSELSDLWIGSIAFVVLILDGLDGYLARRFKTTSEFGAYLDMETDAFFVFTLSCILYHQEKIGWWILGIGCLRYSYVVVLLFFKPKEQKEARDYFAQVIAVILMGSLVSVFLLPEVIYLPALLIAGGLVCFSFGKSFFGVLEIGRGGHKGGTEVTKKG